VTSAPSRSFNLTPRRITGLVGIGLGLVSGGVGAIFGVSSAQGRNQYAAAVNKAMLTDTSPLTRAQAVALDQSVHTSAWVANGLLIGAVVLAIAGGLLLALGGDGGGS
jgi:hypothetical protein